LLISLIDRTSKQPTRASRNGKVASQQLFR
jgi:hypothetical protein